MSLLARIAVSGGGDPHDPLEPNDRMRHVATGIVILAVATWAFGAATFTFHHAVHVSWPLSVGAGLLIAAVIFGLDLAITSSPLKKNSIGSRLTIIGLRGMVSVAMGLVISHATILLMYGSSINQLVEAKNQQNVATHTTAITEGSPYPAEIKAAQQQVIKDQAQLTVANTALTNAQKALDKRKQDWLNDRICVGGTNRAANGDACGEGDVANQLKAAYNDYLTHDWPAAQKLHDQTINALTADIAKQQATIKSDMTALNRAIQTGTAADLDNTGLVAQSQALWTLLKHDWSAWLWVGLFIVIDLAVGFLKAVLPESNFDFRRRTERAQTEKLAALTEHDPVWQEVAVHVAKNEAAVAMARSDVERQRKLAAIEQSVRTAPRRRRGLAWPVAAGLAVAALVATAIGAEAGGDHVSTAGSARPATTKPSVSAAVPHVQPVAYKLAAPTRSVTAQTEAYLAGSGREVVALHQAAVALDTRFSGAGCTRARGFVSDGLAKKIAAIPDPILQELALDEVHEIVAQGACSTKRDAATLHHVVSVTAERLSQLGASS